MWALEIIWGFFRRGPSGGGCAHLRTPPAAQGGALAPPRTLPVSRGTGTEQIETVSPQRFSLSNLANKHCGYTVFSFVIPALTIFVRRSYSP